MSSSREARVLTRSSAKSKGKSIESLVAESSSEEIHMTESEAEILREVEINTPPVIVKKRRRLVLPTSSSSSSHHSTRVPGNLQKRKKNTSLSITLELLTHTPKTSCA